MSRWITAILTVALSVPLAAEQFQYGPKSVAEVTVGAAAATVFTSTDIVAGNGHVQATQATCSLTGANVRYTMDGTTPTTSYGVVLTPGVWTFMDTQSLLNMQMIRDDATNATLNCTVQG